MCGIAGIYSAGRGRVDRQALERMADSIAHRGPDAEGYFVRKGSPSVGLASRRLAVIDIEGGDQPLSIETGQTIVYNGEIYNAHEVRRELESRGHRFQTRCDTEVVIRGYAEWDAGVLDRLNGMWAFAIWDEPRKRLFLGRDRLGVKPLLYAETPDGFVFGSELKALLASGLLQPELNASVIPHYLSFFAIPEPHSLISGVRRLPAGHAMAIDPDGVTEFQYWDCALREDEERSACDHEGEVRGLLDDGVARRLVSDVPLGVLLSSGIDSGLITAFAARHDSDAVKTFTLGFDPPRGDERERAREVARAFATEHTEEGVDAQGASQLLPDLIEHYDEPGQSLLQTDLVSAMARRRVTVALSGLGGDELFAAYPTHVVTNLIDRLDRAPAPVRGAFLAGARIAPIGRAQRLAELAAMSPEARITERLLHQTSAGLRGELLAEDLRTTLDLDAPRRHVADHYERAESRDELNRLLYVYLKTYLPDELLRSTDSMSMRHSLEIRNPFLDYRLVEASMRIPAREKMRFTQGKRPLRAIARELLPSVRRSKQGFSPPVGEWLRGGLEEQVRDLLSEPTVRSRGIFDPKATQRILKECLAGNDRLVPPVMMLFAFEVWAQRWLDRDGAVEHEPAVSVETHPAAASPDLSLVIVNWNTREKLRDCLASIRQHLAGVSYEVLVVDNDSSDGSAAMVEEEFPDVRLIRNEDNVGFGRANNQAMRLARGEWFLLLNSDTLLTDDSVARLFQRIRREPEPVVAHCRLVLPDGRTQHSAYRFPSLRLSTFEALGFYKLMPRERVGTTLLSGYWDYEEERDVDWVAGAFMLMPREVFDRTGGFDESLFMYGEDMEWCYRIRDGGWPIRYYPDASVMHFDHTSADIRWGQERIALCLERQRDIYSARKGRVRGRLLTAILVIGAIMRTAYYSTRVRLGGKRASAYVAELDNAKYTLRALSSLAAGRR
jgi:asparagine synthase (glutamine-hydrolysing)